MDLIDKFFELGFIFYATGYVISELSSYEVIEALVLENRLRVRDPDEKEQLKVEELNVDYYNLSIHDCSCIWLTEKKSAIMLTGDKALTKVGKKLGLEVHGSLWILDKMVEYSIISKQSAVGKLTLLRQINPRTPIQESGELLEKWKKNKEAEMAKNKPYGDSHRKGAVKGRSQVQNPKTGSYVKRDTETGRFIDQKSDSKPFKGVRKEK